MKSFQNKLQQLEDRGRLRSPALPGGIDLTSNDYLGFASHPFLHEAAMAAIGSGMDIGAGGSRLLRGHCAAHQQLEEFAASYFGAESSLYFANGFAANYALFTTLPDRHDVILFDAYIHASAREGIQNSSAKHIRVAHNDLNAYEDALQKARETCTGQVWIAVESLYSMDGDYPDLGALHDLAARYDAMLVIDEAHAVGVFGPSGKGMAGELLSKKGYDNIITLYTCGKALGVAGGLICARKDITDYMINAARPFIYSTAPMPLQAHLTQKSLELLASEDGKKARQSLLDICAHARQKMPDILTQDIATQIVPIILGEDARAVEVATALQESGYDIRAIRPPTVPEGTARLRLSLSANLTTGIIDDFLSILESLTKERQAA